MVVVILILGEVHLLHDCRPLPILFFAMLEHVRIRPWPMCSNRICSRRWCHLSRSRMILLSSSSSSVVSSSSSFSVTAALPFPFRCWNMFAFDHAPGALWFSSASVRAVVSTFLFLAWPDAFSIGVAWCGGFYQPHRGMKSLRSTCCFLM